MMVFDVPSMMLFRPILLSEKKTPLLAVEEVPITPKYVVQPCRPQTWKSLAESAGCGVSQMAPARGSLGQRSTSMTRLPGSRAGLVVAREAPYLKQVSG